MFSTELKIATGNYSWFEMSISSSIKRLQEELKPTVEEGEAYKKFSHIQLRKNKKDDVSRWKYHEYLGVEVPSDALGVLQDIHWSHGSFGYFPTYTIGSFYAAQFFNQAKIENPNLLKSASLLLF